MALAQLTFKCHSSSGAPRDLVKESRDSVAPSFRLKIERFREGEAPFNHRLPVGLGSVSACRINRERLRFDSKRLGSSNRNATSHTGHTPS